MRKMKLSLALFLMSVAPGYANDLTATRERMEVCIFNAVERYASKTCEDAAVIGDAALNSCSEAIRSFEKASFADKRFSHIPYDQFKRLIGETISEYKGPIFQRVLDTRINVGRDCP